MPLTKQTPLAKLPNVGWIRPELAKMLPKLRLITDCLNGQETIKSKTIAYLPKPNASDTSPENEERYKSYLQRAVYYNVTRKTEIGLVGQVFSRDPIVVMPEVMVTNMSEDIDGYGVTLDQQARQGLSYLLSKSRFGILVDYPKVDQAISAADQAAGNIKPSLLIYSSESIINWQYVVVGGKKKLSLVVLVETASTTSDGFEMVSETQWREIRLTAQGCQMTTYTETNEGYEPVTETHTLFDSQGKPLDEIPFFFCGINTNDAAIAEPPLYDLAVLNIAHYRNSADYEDSCFLVGQPTPVFAGLTQQWVEKVFKGRPIALGSRGSVPLPQGGTALLLQANPNSMPMEAMVHKERQMMALGAKLIEAGAGQNTLGQAQIDESTESSALAMAAKNVSMAYTAALKMAQRLYGVTGDISYSLNTDFPASRLTPNERAQLVLEWQSGAITETEMRAGLRKAGVATLDEGDYKKELVANPPPVAAQMTNNQGGGGVDNKPQADKTQNNNGGNQAGI